MANDKDRSMALNRTTTSPALPVSVCALLAALLAMPTQAAAQTARAGALFERADRDGDGAIDAAEVHLLRERAFDRLDADGDGLLTRAEYSAGAERLLSRRDADGDRRLTRDEFFRR